MPTIYPLRARATNYAIVHEAIVCYTLDGGVLWQDPKSTKKARLKKTV